MKRFLLLLLVTATTITLYAQTQRFFITGTVSPWKYDTYYTRKAHARYILEAGININDKWAAGLEYSQTKYLEDEGSSPQKYTYHSYGAFARWSYFTHGRMKLFADASITYFNLTDGLPNYVIGDERGYNHKFPTDHWVECGFKPGINFKLLTNINLLAKYAFIGYSGNNGVLKGSPSSDMRIDLSLNTLQIGVQVAF